MVKNLLVLPNQLFVSKIAKLDIDRIYLYEHPAFFTKFKYNKKKLLLHRATMKNFYEELKEDFEVVYLDYQENLTDCFAEINNIKLFDPVNKEIRKEIVNLAFSSSLKLKIMESPNFLTTMEKNNQYFKENDYFHQEYYKMQRKRLNILLDNDNNPEGGKWSFDSKNRKKFPKQIDIPKTPKFNNKFISEAADYVENNFKDNPGNTENFNYPTDRKEAEALLNNFLEKKLDDFGDYQDAFDEDIDIGFHSLISSSLNIGLISPEKIVEKTLKFYKNNPDTALNSVEGFIRQIIGWREYIRALYELEGDKMFESNFWAHQQKLNEKFYRAETGIKPVDDCLDKADKTAYCHHIERLMVLGNIFMLSEINPQEVYSWFMEMFIDAYDWVMVPNIFAMSQFSYTEMMTKPYISSSNYIKKMSHYKGDKWEKIWDGLYWRFINNNKDKLADIGRMGLMLSLLDRMDEKKLEKHLDNAETFLDSIRN